ncbi:hypothetical protein [Hafnia alvei]|uniref:hypothetical protein n=1 Tax=Hafnia alvei TaxID=569 RepID=UPI0015F195E6|nr:hypothetical protein [Hafnia alvei]
MEKSLRDQWSGSQSKLGAIPLFWDKDQEGKERQQLLESVDGKSSDGPFSFDWAAEMSKNTPKSDPSTGTTPVEKGLGLTFPSPDVGRGTPLPEQTQGLQFSLPQEALSDLANSLQLPLPQTTLLDVAPRTPDAPFCLESHRSTAMIKPNLLAHLILSQHHRGQHSFSRLSVWTPNRNPPR